MKVSAGFTQGFNRGNPSIFWETNCEFPWIPQDSTMNFQGFLGISWISESSWDASRGFNGQQKGWTQWVTLPIASNSYIARIGWCQCCQNFTTYCIYFHINVALVAKQKIGPVELWGQLLQSMSITSKLFSKHIFESNPIPNSCFNFWFLLSKMRSKVLWCQMLSAVLLTRYWPCRKEMQRFSYIFHQPIAPNILRPQLSTPQHKLQDFCWSIFVQIF